MVVNTDNNNIIVHSSSRSEDPLIITGSSNTWSERVLFRQHILVEIIHPVEKIQQTERGRKKGPAIGIIADLNKRDCWLI